MLIKQEKGDVCPVCHYQIIAPNCWVRYHISYKPQMVILACKYCNFVEYKLRNGISGYGSKFNSRWKQVVLYHSKFGITI